MRRLALLIPSIALLVASPSSALPGAVDPEVADRVASHGTAPVIVELSEPVVPEGWLPGRSQIRAQRRRVVERQIAAIYGLGGSDAGPVRPYPVIPFLALTAGPRALAALEASPFVRSVQLARPDAPSLADSVPITQAPSAHALGFDGTGQTVVVLDTGTDLGHVNFPPWKNLGEACFADGTDDDGLPLAAGGDCPGGADTAFGVGAAVPCEYHSECFHGTHVAGIAVGSNTTLAGVAPGAGLIPIQVYSRFPAGDSDCDGDGNDCPRAWPHDTDAALLYVYDTLRHLHTIAAVNMSLSSGSFTAPCDSSRASTKAAIDQLRSVGIATVISTGNNSCGGTGCSDAIGAPACVSSAVSVSASGDALVIPNWANRAPFMSLLAPGVGVVAPLYLTTSQYRSSSGTSMAAPHVAGAWALLRQAVPDGSVSSLLQALRDSGEVVDESLGYTRIQIRDALGQLGFPECDDGLDNDGDGLTDAADPGCESTGDLSEKISSLPCDDGIDNDSDGGIDTADPGCAGPGWPTEAPACSDGIDNDGDGGVDFDGTPADPDCASLSENTEAAASQPSCGLGPGLALLLPLLRRARRR